MSFPTDFDFLVDSWKIQNKRINSSGIWETFDGYSTGIKYLDGQMILDTYNAIFPSGFELKFELLYLAQINNNLSENTI